MSAELRFPTGSLHGLPSGLKSVDDGLVGGLELWGSDELGPATLPDGMWTSDHATEGDPGLSGSDTFGIGGASELLYVSGFPWDPDCRVLKSSLPDQTFIENFLGGWVVADLCPDGYLCTADGSPTTFAEVAGAARGFEPWLESIGMPGGATELDSADQLKVQAALELLTCPLSLLVIKFLHDELVGSSLGLDETIYRAMYHIVPADQLFPDVEGLSEDESTGSPIADPADLLANLEYWTQPPALDPTPPIIGVLNEENPFFKSVYSEEGLVATTLVGTADTDKPDGFVFPLNWVSACHRRVPVPDEFAVYVDADVYYAPIRLPAGIVAKLNTVRDFLRGTATLSQVNTVLLVPSLFLFKIPVLRLVFFALLGSVAKSFRALAESLDDATDALLVNDGLAALAQGARQLTDSLVRPVKLIGGVVKVVLKTADWFSPAWDWVKNLLSSADDSEEDDEASLSGAIDAVEEFIDTFGEIDDQAFFGLDRAGAAWLQLGLMTQTSADWSTFDDPLPGTITDDLGLALRPVLSLDQSWFDFYFDDYALGYEPDSSTGSWPGASSNIDVLDWLAYAGPTLQFARTVDLASRIFELLLHQESLLLTASGLGETEGMAGSIVRDLFKDEGAECLIEIMGGLPVSRLFRYLWRQSMVDFFVVTAMVELDADEECLWNMFCWTDSSLKRAVTDRVLGEFDSDLSRFENADWLLLEVGAGIVDTGDGVRKQSDALLTEFGDDICTWWSGLGCLGAFQSRKLSHSAASSITLQADGLCSERDLVKQFMVNQSARCAVDPDWFDGLEAAGDSFIDEVEVDVLVKVLPSMMDDSVLVDDLVELRFEGWMWPVTEAATALAFETLSHRATDSAPRYTRWTP